MKRLPFVALLALVPSCTEEPPPRAPHAAPNASASSPVLGALPEAPTEAPPLGRLGAEVTPTHYGLELAIDPSQERFSGEVTIDVNLASSRRSLWMHGRGLHVTEATLTANGKPAHGTWTQVHPSGVASLVFDAPVPAGKATLHLTWDAPFDRHGEGLYRVDRGNDHYAFTQFESLAARRAFPSFDEPRFKVPFDVSLRVPEGLVAIGNTHEIKREKGKVTFATTEPLPTYLLAWAVGPLDVVEAPAIAPNEVRKQPLPFRGIAAKGRGKELAYALKHTPEIVQALERWFGSRYPYDKLDILAVPERGGAMENAGAITYAEMLLLLDDEATAWRKRSFASVSAHELAHQWFGDLVTMPWWNDIWLNEAFATWMGTHTQQAVEPQSNAEITLTERMFDNAMGGDALVASRSIRQPVDTEHDVYNAFDAITYVKGASVLSMFERWIGKDTFQKGIRRYLAEHAHGNATADDLMRALGTAANKDVGTAFKTFLDAPGVPLLDAKLDCTGQPALVISQRRWVPLGGKGDKNHTWQIPLCARTPDGEACTLLTKAEERVNLPGKTCPAWVMPNADAASYVRFTMPKSERDALLGKAWPKLDTKERLAVANAVHVGWSGGFAHADEIFSSLAPLANDAYPSIASAPTGYYASARSWAYGTELQAKIEAHARKLYAKPWAALGWDAKKGESAETAIRRSSIAWFLAFTAQDPAVRKEASRRGHAYVEGGVVHEKAVDGNIAHIALAVAVQEDPALFDVLLGMLGKTDDEVVRGRILSALSSVTDAKLSMRALALVFDPRLHTNELLGPMWTQMGQVETRELAWKFLLANFDAIVARVSSGGAGALPSLVGRFCDDKHRSEAEAFFRPKLDALEGAPRNFAAGLETLDLCVARRAAQSPGVASYFAK